MGGDGSGRLRVLHVSQPNAGGVAVYIGQVVRDQRRRGWDVAVACPVGGDLSRRCAAAGVPWFGWDARRAPGPATLLEVLRLRRLVRGFAPDVVHLHSSKAGLAGRLAPRVPTIFQPHGWSWLAATGRQASFSELWERRAAGRTGALVCVGEGELREGMRAGVRGPYRLVRNGVDRRRFRPADGAARLVARARLGLPASAPLVLCVGRLTRQKGQDVLVAAWPDVLARCPSARLVLVGDGEDRDRLRGSAPAGVLFVPAVADPRDWLRAASLVALPSRWEGLPLTALEAIAMGRCLVGTDIPGIREVVRPGCGALVPPEDPGALAAAIVPRLLCPGIAEEEGHAGAAASAAFDLTGTLSMLAAVTRDVAAGQPRAGSGAGAVGGGTVNGGVTAGFGALDGVAGFAGFGGLGEGTSAEGASADGAGEGAVVPPNSSR
ncbi:glycosyltransferase [Actinomadura sp. NEAU-AAG7]|uniref:glycosyltransferase n=1 Tax=Actinomadura sp. NEAU-AAG7 TaxID=2839640 RepID=UPI001BE4A7A8|nr:glycosyltransferase [Actinomadura sp. NEAU-AAG7]